jgi:hypothetical protein
MASALFFICFVGAKIIKMLRTNNIIFKKCDLGEQIMSYTDIG